MIYSYRKSLSDGVYPLSEHCRPADPVNHRGDQFVQRLHAEGDVMQHTVDEKARSRAQMASPAARFALANLLQVDVITHLGSVANHVESEIGCIMGQVPFLEVELMCEQGLVHRPELSLRRGRLRGLGREQRLRMRVHDRKMPINKSNLVGITLEQQCRRRRRELAARARVISILDDRHLRMLGS